MGEKLNWFALRIMYIFSPVTFIIALATFASGQVAGGHSSPYSRR